MSRLIFLIDDDDDEKDIFQMAFGIAQSACEFVYHNSVENALNMLEWIKPDFIFIDMNMPGTDGINGIKMIRKIKNMNEVPLILYSNGINDSLCTAAKKAGATSCLKKSGSIKDLADYIKKLF